MADTQAPIFDSVTLDDTELNFAEGETTVTINFDISDPGSGVLSVYAILLRPDAVMARYGIVDQQLDNKTVRANGEDKFSGSVSFDLPDALITGEYVIHLHATDGAFNTSFIRDEGMGSGLFDTTFRVINPNGDTNNPQLDHLEISEPITNVEGQQEVTINYAISDIGAGLESAWIELRSPNRDQEVYEELVERYSNVSSQEGSLTLTVPANFANGEYELYIGLLDAAQNRTSLRAEDISAQGFDPYVTIAGQDADTDAPRIVDAVLLGSTFNAATGNRTASFELTIAEESGINYYSFSLVSPTGQYIEAAYDANNYDEASGMLSLNPKVTIILPEHFSDGAYALYMFATDNAQNVSEIYLENVIVSGSDISFTFEDVPDADTGEFDTGINQESETEPETDNVMHESETNSSNENVAEMDYDVPQTDDQLVRERGEILDESDIIIQINGKQLADSQAKLYNFDPKSSGQDSDDSDLDILSHGTTTGKTAFVLLEEISDLPPTDIVMAEAFDSLI